jgi:hypothetical protein
MEMKYLFNPYEQALALKELGFDEPCFAKYTFIPEDEINWFTIPEQGITNKTTFGSSKNYNSKSFEEEGTISAPTYSQAFRWFRENHNLVYQINYLYNGNYQVVIHKNTHEYMELIQDLEHACVDEIPDNYSYEEAELACLIKLIEIVKNK